MGLNLPNYKDILYEKQLRLLYKNTVSLILPEKLAALKNNRTDFYLLDTRSPQEFAISHLAGARLIGSNPIDLKWLKNNPLDALVVVYCTIGVRSERVGEQLKKAGFTQVYNLYGGLIAWKNHGYPVVNPDRQLTDRVHTYNRYWAVWLQNGTKVYA